MEVSFWNRQIETAGKSELKDLQLKRLKIVIDWALKTGFYKRRLNKAGIKSGDDIKSLDKTKRIEDIIDEFQFHITSYLVLLSERQLSSEVSIELPVLLHMVNDLERIGDHAVNISEIAHRKIDAKFTLSDSASVESKEMIGEILRMSEYIITALKNENIQAAHEALISENKLNRMQVDLRRSHVQRMTDGICTAQGGVLFIDLSITSKK